MKELISQLENLKNTREGGSPDERWIASTRETLLMQINNTTTTNSKKTFARNFQEFVSVFRPENLTRAIATPLAVVLLMFGTWMTGSAVTDAARDTLPGETLYSMKLLGEKLSLRTSSKEALSERRLDIAGRRLEEMSILASTTDSLKTEKLAALSERFALQMDAVREDLTTVGATGDAEASILLALRVDAVTDEYQAAFASNNFTERADLRMALLSLDRTAVKALELLVNARSAVAVLPEAQLSANVERSISIFASRVAVAEGSLGGDASVPEARIEMTIAAKTAAQEAKEFFEEGDFKAAVKRVMEGTELVNEAETATDPIPEPVVESATDTSSVIPESSTEDIRDPASKASTSGDPDFSL